MNKSLILILPVLFLVGCQSETASQPTTPTPAVSAPPPPPPLPIGVLDHQEEFGQASTNTAGNACKMHAKATIARQPNGDIVLSASLETTNYALTDNCVGAVKISVLDGSASRGSYIVKSDRNPGRGFPWNGPTVRGGSLTVILPTGVKFDKIAFAFWNADHGGEPVDLGKIVQLAVAVAGAL